MPQSDSRNGILELEDNNTSNGMHIALQVMKERCSSLQKRISSLEDENSKLKLEQISLSDVHAVEKDLLSKIVDLTKQKTHMTQHVLMVTCENKKLWDYLSKSNSALKSLKNEESVLNDTQNEMAVHLPKTSGLLRSETFIQSAPNTKQLKKNVDNLYNDSSLEEISLKLINSFLQEKSDLVDQYEQMVDLQAVDDKLYNASSISFNFVDDFGSESFKDIKKQTDKLKELKKELLKQQFDLQSILSSLERLKLGQGCKKCDMKTADIAFKHNQISKSEPYPENEILDSLTKWATPENSTSYQDNTCDQSSLSQVYGKKDESSCKVTMENLQTNTEVLSKNGTSLLKDSKDLIRMCPMCGKYFGTTTSFEVFTQHVQTHFICEEDDTDSLVDNYELVLNSIDNGLK